MQNRPNRVYLDHNATTPHSDRLKLKWNELFELSGNPSSIHQDSRAPKTWIRETRQKIADELNCSPLEIIFNSGASEGNSSILKSVWDLLGSEKPEMLISSVEHPSVMKTAQFLQSKGARIHFIPVSKNGEIDLNFIRQHLSNKTSLVSVMYANNETGTIFPIAEISEMAHAAGALMHSDCVQMLGKDDVEFETLNVDYATFSAHKFYALKGTGFAFVRKSSPWVPLINGGGQERSRRGGTENITGIAAMGIVLDSLVEVSDRVKQMTSLRDSLEKQILEKISGVTITAVQGKRISNTSSLVIENVDGETLLMSLDLKGFSVSTGAACSSGNPEPSPVLLAMGLTRDEAQSSLRVSVGWSTTQEQVDSFVECLVAVVAKLRELNEKEKSGEYAL
jgi:cysteine desulfurase